MKKRAEIAFGLLFYRTTIRKVILQAKVCLLNCLFTYQVWSGQADTSTKSLIQCLVLIKDSLKNSFLIHFNVGDSAIPQYSFSVLNKSQTAKGIGKERASELQSYVYSDVNVENGHFSSWTLYICIYSIAWCFVVYVRASRQTQPIKPQHGKNTNMCEYVNVRGPPCVFIYLFSFSCVYFSMIAELCYLFCSTIKAVNI